MNGENEILGACSGAQIVPPAPALIAGHTGSVSTRACFASQHTGFHGHFPGNAVLPGFLHIELVLDILRYYFKEVELVAVRSAKYILPILPDQIVEVNISIAVGVLITARLQVADAVVSVLDLTVSGMTEDPAQKS